MGGKDFARTPVFEPKGFPEPHIRHWARQVGVRRSFPSINLSLRAAVLRSHGRCAATRLCDRHQQQGVWVPSLGPRPAASAVADQVQAGDAAALRRRGRPALFLLAYEEAVLDAGGYSSGHRFH